MRGRIFALAAISILLMGGVAALETGHQESVRSGDEVQTVENETWTVDAGNWTQLDAPGGDAAAYSQPANVTVYQNGSEVQRAGNWTWDDHDARIKATDGGTLVDGDQATVTYQAFPASGAQQATQSISMLPLSTLASAWPFVLGVVLLLGAGALFAGRA
jgi:hypothetical protein